MSWISSFRKTFPYFLFVYIVSELYGFWVSLFLKKNIRIEKKIKQRTALLFYSKKHFDPTNPEQTLFKESSAGCLARNIFRTLEKNFSSVSYFDQDQDVASLGLKTDDSVDLIVGTSVTDFPQLKRLFPEARCVLFLVNAHSIYRLRSLLLEACYLRKMFPPSEYVSPIRFLSRLKGVDLSILIGNSFVEKTYLTRGFRKENLCLINSGVHLERLVPNRDLYPKNKVRFLFVASHLALRKGLFRVMDFWTQLQQYYASDRIELIIVGGVDRFEQDVHQFVSQHNNVQFLGWIDSSEERYKTILQSCQVVLGWSIEEGQVGCILEAMSTGVIPIVTEQCGIALTDVFKELTIHSYRNTKSVAGKVAALLEDQERLKSLSLAARQFVETYHSFETFNTSVAHIVLYGSTRID